MSPSRFPLLLVLLILLLMSVVLVPAHAAESDPEVARTLAILRQAERYDDEAVGYAGEKTLTFEAYEVLRERASGQELVELAGDPAPVVRCYAVRALVERHPEVPLGPVILRHLDDTAPVPTAMGCCLATELVGDVMLHQAWPRLAPEEEHAVLERLLTPSCPLEERKRVLRQREFDPAWRPRLRRLAEDGDDLALIALSRFRREEDTDLIRPALGAESRPYISRFPALQAAAHSGSHALMRELSALEGEAHIALGGRAPHHASFWYQAVAAQESPEAAALLEHARQARDLPEPSRHRNPEMLREALEPHLVPAFRPLLWRLWIDDAQLSPGILVFLAADDAERAASQCVQDLEGRLNATSDRCLPAMLDLMERQEPERLVPALAEALGIADVHHFEALARCAARLAREELEAPLLQRFSSDTNPHVYLAAARALLDPGRPALRETLLSIVTRTPHLQEGWGGEELVALLSR